MSVIAFIGDLKISPMAARSVKGPVRDLQASDEAGPARSNDPDPRHENLDKSTNAVIF